MIEINGWQWAGDDFKPDDYVGYIYEIKNTVTGQAYIGKKIFWNTIKRPPLKGKKRKRISKKESDWGKYWGSSTYLLDDLEKFGKENFTRTILSLCRSKGELHYMEVVIQVKLNVLTETLPNGAPAYYNGAIGNKICGFIKPGSVSPENECWLR